ncbi:MAG: carboxypeptidase regulatory-like domain-containing protein [Acidobacteria bacterium]|nr:carboxypeptidase regulatory-like domain-containing protein [Acidobacteriota bacterium]
MKLLAFFCALPLFATVDGTVINKTTGKPQAAATVTLYKLGGAGMESVETVKSDATGSFKMTTNPEAGPYLIQAAYDGVTYNKMLQPGQPRTGVEVEVYQSAAKPGGAKVTQHMLLFEVADNKLTINENIVYENTGTTTYNDPAAGTLRFYLPPETGGKVKVMATAPNGMPVERATNPGKGENQYSVDFPIKPGDTRFQLIYEMPATAPMIYTGKLLHKEGTTRLVTPKGITLKGDGISELGREPATQALIYNLAKADYKVEIEGAGTLRDTPAAGGQGGEEEGPGIQEILPRIYTKLPVVLALVFAILLLGFLLLYRSAAGAGQSTLAEATPQGSGKGKRRG